MRVFARNITKIEFRSYHLIPSLNLFQNASNMKPSRVFLRVASTLIYLVATSAHDLSRTQFSSHVSVNTPASSFTHGVGDPVSLQGRRTYQPPPQPYHRGTRRPSQHKSPSHSTGYTRQKPVVPFRVEEVTKDTLTVLPWQYNFMDYSIPVLPPSPYKVDSPDPESLWPTGLFLPPLNNYPFGPSLRRSENSKGPEDVSNDPYLLEGSEAISAVLKSRRHGQLYFHDIPHINSLLANQELRIKNNLMPHRIGSIRKNWPYYRT